MGSSREQLRRLRALSRDGVALVARAGDFEIVLAPTATAPPPRAAAAGAVVGGARHSPNPAADGGVDGGRCGDLEGGGGLGAGADGGVGGGAGSGGGSRDAEAAADGGGGGGGDAEAWDLCVPVVVRSGSSLSSGAPLHLPADVLEQWGLGR